MNAPVLPRIAQGDGTVLRDCVADVVHSYLQDLQGHNIDNLYEIVMQEVEAPFLQAVLNHTGGNQTKAAELLGINRGTLRKKLQQHNIQ